MFSGGDDEEVGRWLSNFARSHAKREHPRVEAVVEHTAAPEGGRFGVRVRLGERLVPTAADPPLALTFTEVSAGRGSLAWCQALADKIRALARVAAAEREERRSA